MPAAVILVDKDHDVMRLVISAVQQQRAAAVASAAALAAVTAYKTGDGSVAIHFDLLATECTFEAGDYADANTAAKMLYDELNSVAGNGETAGNAAEQLAGLLGV